jgi:hypothetical protein
MDRDGDVAGDGDGGREVVTEGEPVGAERDRTRVEVTSRSRKGRGKCARSPGDKGSGRGGGEGGDDDESTDREESTVGQAEPQGVVVEALSGGDDSECDDTDDDDDDDDDDEDDGEEDDDGDKDYKDGGEEEEEEEEVEEAATEEEDGDDDDDNGDGDSDDDDDDDNDKDRDDDAEEGMDPDEKGAMRGIINSIAEGSPSVLAWLRNESGTAGTRSSKITEIVRILRGIPAGEKAIIFSTFASTLDLIASACRQRLPGVGFVQIDGTIKGQRREAVLNKFKANPSVRLLLMTYRIGSEGLNLTVATHVICVEPWWTNAVHDQAEARAWRTGQTEDVHVYRVYVRDSIEERILDICSQKTEISQKMLGGASKKGTGLDRETLGRILGLRG